MTEICLNSDQSDHLHPRPQSWFYRAFGMIISSDLQLDQLTSTDIERDDDVDLRISKAEKSAAQLVSNEFFDVCLRNSDTTVDQLYWQNVGSFNVIGSDRIEYAPNAGASPSLISLPLLGIVMAVLLHRRGVLVLHGSAVSLDGDVHIFVGDKGAGKSTTAAALLAKGGVLLTDDIVALRLAPDGGVFLDPGHPQVKLTHEATSHIGLKDARILDAPFSDYDKHIHVFDGPFDTEPLAVSNIFVLERAKSFEIRRLSSTEALKAIMRFAFLTRFGTKLFHGSQAATFLTWCSHVARHTPVSTLSVPHDLEALENLAGFLVTNRPDPAE